MLLIIFGLINLANFKLYKTPEVAPANREGVIVFGAMVVLSFMIEFIYHRIRGGKIQYLVKLRNRQ